MNNEETKQLCLSLLHCDSEEEVVSILEQYGFWNQSKTWRFLGDQENNYSVIGNQQSRPEAALTEKVINSIDARLMNECYVKGVDPCSADAPNSIRHAVGHYFGGKLIKDESGGSIFEWDNKKRREISDGITVALTGSKKRPCVTISDIGEGQVPNEMPSTFLSICGSNKLRIPFVQGKFNMGGTGVLGFCGKYNFQLIISRRNPNILKKFQSSKSTSDQFWGFTIVRIQNPTSGMKSSYYTYLAPVDADRLPNKGGVPRFKADHLSLFPEGNNAYTRETSWGSTIKLYDYDMKGFSSHACMKDGLLYRIGALIPEPALPIRIHECRDFKGHKGSYDTTLTGLSVRLEDNKADNIESGFPDSIQFQVHGQKMLARIYAFKKGRAETYRTKEGVILTVNGQTHGTISKNIFNRCKMGRIADSILLIIDCSDLEPRTREILFMNSRDRLRNNEFKIALEEEIFEIIHDHPGLRKLKEQRRSEEVSEKLDDSKPLENILHDILKTSPALSALLLTGTRLSNPFNTKRSGPSNGKDQGTKKGTDDYKGLPHPSYFRFENKKSGDIFDRYCEVDRRCRVKFETDVENQYFKRQSNPGHLELEVLEGSISSNDIDWNISLYNGSANISIKFPDNIRHGDCAILQFVLSDNVIQEPFVNIARISFTPKVDRQGGTKKHNEKHSGSGDDLSAGGIEFPKHNRVHEHEWDNYSFDKYSACKVLLDEDEHGKDLYEFNINVDNIYLRTEIKSSNKIGDIEEAKFVYANILFGLGAIKYFKDHSINQQDSLEDDGLEDKVSSFLNAIGAFILPVINNLGSLDEDAITVSSKSGEDDD